MADTIDTGDEVFYLPLRTMGGQAVTITYDADGRCSRCGSTGYYTDQWGGFKHCPCHGWRPIECLDIPEGEFIDLCGPMLKPIEARSVGLCGFRDAADDVITADVTHFRPRPQPPEGV